MVKQAELYEAEVEGSVQYAEFGSTAEKEPYPPARTSPDPPSKSGMLNFRAPPGAAKSMRDP